MKLYITLDLEGVTSVTALEQVKHGSPEFESTRRLLTDEINAAIEGGLVAGVKEILVNEGHGKHRNVIPERLNKAARLLSGRNKLFHMMHGIDAGYEGMFMIGYHAGAGKAHGILGHTFHAYQCRVNDRVFSEIGLCMGLAGYYGVPALLVTGDQEACRDALELVPNLETVAVKEAISANAAIHLHPEIAQQKIRDAARRAVERKNEIQPLAIAEPLVMELQLYGPLMADIHALIPGCERVDDRTVRHEATNFEDLYKFFLLSSTLSMTTHGLGVLT